MNILKLKIHYIIQKERFNMLKDSEMGLNLCLIQSHGPSFMSNLEAHHTLRKLHNLLDLGNF